MIDQSKIRCPNCAELIDVSKVLYQQLQSQVSSEYERKFSMQKDQLDKSQQRLKEQHDDLTQKIQQGVELRLVKEKSELTVKIKERLDNENQSRFAMMREELAEKSDQVKQMHQLKAQLERQKRENEEYQLKLEAQTEKKMSQQLAMEREKLQKQEAEKSRLKLAHKDQVIEQLRVQAEQAQRKAEQGSMQIQGEVQELAIEEWLRQTFPLDSIKEVKKGSKGADCLQTINTHSRRNIGTIYYESKRTKSFQYIWLEKLKHDMQLKQASVAVLVTQVLPKEIDRIGQLEGIWICRFEDLSGFVEVLRESLIQVSRVIVAQDNKGDKINLLYAYLTGPEFRVQIESMVEGFIQMKEDLDRERRAMEMLWKKREKQIEKVLFNANHFYGSIRGIMGNAVPEVSALEFPDT